MHIWVKSAASPEEEDLMFGVGKARFVGMSNTEIASVSSSGFCLPTPWRRAKFIVCIGDAL